MVKEIIRTDTFIDQLKRLDKSYLDRIEKIVIKIINNPKIGKPMRFDRKGTREVYVSPFRLMYLYDVANDILYVKVFNNHTIYGVEHFEHPKNKHQSNHTF